MSKQDNWIDIGEDITDAGWKHLKKGQILRFRNENGETELKIQRLRPARKQCLVSPVKTFLPEELDGVVSDIEE